MKIVLVSESGERQVVDVAEDAVEKMLSSGYTRGECRGYPHPVILPR